MHKQGRLTGGLRKEVADRQRQHTPARMSDTEETTPVVEETTEAEGGEEETPKEELNEVCKTHT